MTSEPFDDHCPAPERTWRAYLEDGRFMLLRGRRSGTFFFYPRVVVPGLGEEELDWVEASGRGTVYSTTTIFPRPPRDPYNVALIDLAEGPRMMSRVEGIDPDAVTIGLDVTATVVVGEAGPLVVFVPRGEA